MKSPLYIGVLLSVFLTVSASAAGDDGQGSIAGVVVSVDTRQPLAFANVVLEGTKWGAKANENGEFFMESVPVGTYTVVGQLLGYAESKLEDVSVKPGQTSRVTIELVERAIPLGEIQITAERMKKLEDIRSSVLSVAPIQAKRLPGVGEDIMRTLQALPGILSPNEVTSQLIVRGSGPDQNLIIMDDIEIFNPYRLYGFISMFNPETASDINLITGGFPARYGDRLSAVLDVSNKDGDKSTPLKGMVNASITNANIVLNGRSPLGLDGSYLLSARRTYYDLILGPIAKHYGFVSGDVAFPNFADFQYKFVFEPGGGHRIIATGVFDKDAVNLVTGPKTNTPDSAYITDETRNDVAGFAWHYVPSKKYYSKLTFSWYRNRGASEFGGELLDPALDRELFVKTSDTTGLRLYNVEFDLQYVFRKNSLKEEMSWFLGDHTVELGGGLDLLSTSLLWHFRPDETFRGVLRSQGVVTVENFVQTKESERLNFYIQDKVKLGERLSIQTGLRIDYYTIIDGTYFSPRLNISYRLDPITTLRAAWGLYYQSPGYEKLLDTYSLFDLTNILATHVKAERATHYVLGVDRWIDNRWQFRAETYYKRFNDVIVTAYQPGTIYQVYPIPGADPRKPSGWTSPVAVTGDSLTALPINGATGESYGVELFLEKRNVEAGDRLSGWLGYSLAKAERTRGSTRTPFRFDQRHTVNLVLDYMVNSWLNLGIHWRYGTNFPYTRPVGLKPRVITEIHNGQTEKVIQTDSKGNVIFDIDRGSDANKGSGRLPEYHRLDFRATARADYWGLDWDFYLDVINVYNRKNILAYRFFMKDDLTIGTSEISMLPIVPTLGVAVRF